LQGSAIVDALPTELSRKATHFVSWCWGYSIETVTSALSLWHDDHQRHSDGHMYFWMCFFCNNQRKMLIQQNCDGLTDTFGTRLEKVGSMIILLDNYAGPYYTKRVWCIYETYVATTKGITTDVAIPRKVKEAFSKTLEHGGFSEIAVTLSDIDTQAAQATVQADADEIKDLITKSIGFTAVNETVKFALINWLASAFGDHLKLSSVSKVARSVFDLIAGKSGKTFLRMKHWVRATREHPKLFDYLNLADALPEESFCLLCSSPDEQDTLTLQDQQVDKGGELGFNLFVICPTSR
jgi:hypothetical protein